MRQVVSQRESRALGESPVAVNGQARGFGARNQVWGDNVAEIKSVLKLHLGATFHVLSAIGAIASFQTPGGAPRTSKKLTLKSTREIPLKCSRLDRGLRHLQECGEAYQRNAPRSFTAKDAPLFSSFSPCVSREPSSRDFDCFDSEKQWDGNMGRP